MRKLGRRSEEDPSNLDCANPAHTTCQKPVQVVVAPQLPVGYSGGGCTVGGRGMLR